MAGRLLDDDPETAYLHAQVAAQRAGRVDIVREAAAITAYATGRYAEALREFRTVRRLNGSQEHLALMADCERGLGRPERAVLMARSDEASQLSPEARFELELVVAGARADMGDADAGLVALGRLKASDATQSRRVLEARIELLRRAGRTDEADALEAELSDAEPDADEVDVTVFDMAELPDPDATVETVADAVPDESPGATQPEDSPREETP
jgi:tetratricopeptide (TPR) repeat protein